MKKMSKQNYLILSILSLLLVAALVFYLLPRNTNTNVENAGEPTFGQILYQENCASCHGNLGQGHQALKEAPALNGSEHSWHHADSQIKNLIRNGGIKMPAVGKDFSEDELEAVMSYYKGWWNNQQKAFQQKASLRNP